MKPLNWIQTSSQSKSKSIHSKPNFLLILLTLSLLHFQSGKAQLVQDITEMVLYSNVEQGDKSYNFYKLPITGRYFTGSENLAIKAMTTEPGSDPDIFISKTVEKPKDSSQSQWYCMKIGSDTCIIPSNQITIGDTLYIGIRCLNECKYDLRAFYSSIQQIFDNTRTQFRLDGHSTNIFQYTISQDAVDGLTNFVKFEVETENNYSPIDMYLSIDNDFYLIEEKKDAEITKLGKVIRFTNKESGWCTKCTVYLILEVTDIGRYYITGTGRARNPVISKGSVNTAVANLRQQECYQYYLEDKEKELMIDTQQFQGSAEIYIKAISQPTSFADANFVSARAPKRKILISVEDRTRFNLLTGLYYFCVFSYSDTSVQIFANEDFYNKLQSITDHQLVSYTLPQGGYYTFRYTDLELRYNTTLTIKLRDRTKKHPTLPKIYYRVCPSKNAGDCYMTEGQAKGGTGVTELQPRFSESTNDYNEITAFINHNPAACPDPSSCYYIFSTYIYWVNFQTSTSFEIFHQKVDPTDIQLDTSYRNILNYGTYDYYEFIPSQSVASPYVDSIKITLRVYKGDGDLYASIKNRYPNETNHEYSSNQFGETTEEIVLTRVINFNFTKGIFISIYAQTLTFYQLDVVATYSPAYNAILEKAQPLQEMIPSYQYFPDEFHEAFFSFAPWWPGQQERTILFVIQPIFNPKVFFQAKVNDYPLFYTTELKDENNVIAVKPNSPQYNLDGRYFIRVRPDFQAQDLISQRQYIFNFFAFSQLPDRVHTDIYAGESTMGYANRTVKYYRHLITNDNYTYHIQVKPIIGDPSLLIKMSNDPAYPHPSDSLSFNFRVNNPGLEEETITMTRNQRLLYFADCGVQSKYPSNNGLQFCVIYIGVYCDSECVYNITVNTTTELGKYPKIPPKYLVENNMYTGRVAYGNHSFFYFPIHRNNTGDMAIVFNKTSPIGKNGDIQVFGFLQIDGAINYENWVYPTAQLNQFQSATQDVSQPEVIEICGQTFYEQCPLNKCALVLGVKGLTINKTSTFSINTFTAQNRLFNGFPRKNKIAKAGEYQYYWFSNNATLKDKNAVWDHYVSVQLTNASHDVDLFISAMDGRLPGELDYDWASTNKGPDDIHISNNDSFFSNRGYNTSVGIIFVVGIKAITDNAEYSVNMYGPKIKFSKTFNKINHTYFKIIKELIPKITELRTYQEVKSEFNNGSQFGQYNFYKWYNWGGKDFRIQVECQEGEVYVFMNFIEEEQFRSNAYLGIPVNSNNTKYSVFLNFTQMGSAVSNITYIYKNDVDKGMYCYFCWYTVTIMSNYTKKSRYSIYISENGDKGSDIQAVRLGNPTTLTFGGISQTEQRKFNSNSKAPITIDFSISIGSVNIYVGLYPESPLERYAFTRQQASGTTSIRIRTTDPSFKLSAFYYVTIQSLSFRSSVTFTVKQTPELTQLQNQVTIKDQYYTQEEQVKFYYFQVPTGSYSVQFNILALTEDFYPIIYLLRNNLTTAPSDFQTLQYPNVTTYTQKLGDVFYDYLGQSSLSMKFSDTANLTNTYFTMALYSFSYGLTDRRKAQFKIQVKIDTLNVGESIYQEFVVDQENQDLFLQIREKEGESKGDSYLETINDWFGDMYSQIERQVQKTIQQFIHN